MLEEYVKSFYWYETTWGRQDLIIQRAEPDNFSVMIFYSYSLGFTSIFEREVKEFYIKGDYFFYTKKSTKVQFNTTNKIKYKFG